MKTKLINCGNYGCDHCASDGRCSINTISINSEGKCVCFKPKEKRTFPSVDTRDEMGR